MKIRSYHIALFLLITTVVVAFSGHVAHAQANAISSLFNLDLAGFFLAALANLAYYALTVASWFLTVCGTLLNASINLTLHISQLLVTVPAVYTTWALIRDLSSMFFIFALLYAAIMMILGVEKQGFGDLVKNIIIAGVLINFSFFFVSVMIDASNIISLQLYRAIAPGKEYGQDINSLSSLASQAFNDGGISNVFMQALQPQTFYENKGQLSGKDVSMQMLIGGVGGTVVMIIAALSFLVAALAFCIRTGMLLLLLAFSPLWMAGKVIPQIKSEIADPWWNYLYSNLVFMPVYLLLLYVAMRMLLGDNPPDTAISHILNKTGGKTSDGVLGASYFGMILNYVIAIMLINAPLLAAMKVGGSVMGLSKKYSGMLTSKMGSWAKGGAMATGGYAARSTIGRAASIADKHLANTSWGNKLISRDLRAATLGKVASSKFGTKRSYGDTLKEQKDVDKKQHEIERTNEFHANLVESRKPPVIDPATGRPVPPIIDPATGRPMGIASTFDKMSVKEKLALGAKNLKDPNVVKHLKKSDFEAISKSDDYSVDDQKEIMDARRAAFVDAAKNDEADTIKFMLSNMNEDDKKAMSDTRAAAFTEAVNKAALRSSKTLENMVNTMTGKDLMATPEVTRPEVVKYLKNSQLKEMADESIDSTRKTAIGRMIRNWALATTFSGGATHRAKSFIDDPRNSHWL